MGAFYFGEHPMTTVIETRRRYSAELEGDWAVFAKIAGYFVHEVPPEDREDFLHDLLVEMVKVKEKYDAKGKTLTEAGLMRVSRYEVLGYWEKRRYRLFKPNCRYCTSEQRQECREMRFPSECPKGKGRRLLSLDKPVKNNNGKLTKVNELIADNKSINPGPKLDAKLDARRILQGLPKRLVKIAYKRYAGISLETKEAKYLKLWQKEHRAPLVWGRDHLDERVLNLLRENPQGLTRSDLSTRLLIYVRELNLLCLNQLIKSKQILAVKRESTRGRPPTPLLVIAGATIPEEKNVAAERDERIRHAYFIEGWSIKRINRVLHHDKRTIRRAIQRGRAAGIV